MKLISVVDFLKTNSLNENELPFFYSPKHEEFLSNIENKKTVLVCDTLFNSLICKTWKNKFLTLLQPMYPPLSKKGLRLNADEEKIFLNKFVSFIKTNKLAHRITQAENFAIFQSQPDASIAAPFGTYFLNLATNTEDELFKNLHSKHRNVIRNAEKHGVIVKYGPALIEDFYALYEQTMQRSNMYCQTLNYFKEFYNYLPGNTICGVAYINQKPEGALFIPFTQFGAFYLYGASSEKMEINGSINFLHWNTIKLLKKKAVKRYDFVGARLSDVSGTRLEGIQQFKERFGASLEKGVLWKKDVDKITCKLFDNLVTLKLSLKNQKPPLDIIDQEIKKQNV